jgi:RHS repeat-associated protein
MTHKAMDGGTWDYTWTKDNFLETVSKDGLLTAEMTYDAWGQRSKKVFHAASGATVTTLYFGKTYEKRTYSDGALAQHTIYIYANGQAIAQWTKAGSSATALNSPYRWRTELAAASLYNGHDLKGALKKTYHYLNAAALHPDSARWVVLAFLLLFLTGVLASLVASKLGHAALPTSFSPGLRWASLSVLMLFTLSACGGSGSSGGRLFSVESYQVAGDTLRGLPAGLFFLLRNQVNSTTVVTDASGTEVSRFNYLPFGEVVQDHSSGGSAATRKYTGQERDEETGLDYFNARYYDPAIGRFISADTVIPDVLNGNAFNRFTYALNNPIRNIDPTGRYDTESGNGDSVGPEGGWGDAGVGRPGDRMGGWCDTGASLPEARLGRRESSFWGSYWDRFNKCVVPNYVMPPHLVGKKTAPLPDVLPGPLNPAPWASILGFFSGWAYGVGPYAGYSLSEMLGLAVGAPTVGLAICSSFAAGYGFGKLAEASYEASHFGNTPADDAFNLSLTVECMIGALWK